MVRLLKRDRAKILDTFFTKTMTTREDMIRSVLETGKTTHVTFSRNPNVVPMREIGCFDSPDPHDARRRWFPARVTEYDTSVSRDIMKHRPVLVLRDCVKLLIHGNERSLYCQDDIRLCLCESSCVNRAVPNQIFLAAVLYGVVMGIIDARCAIFHLECTS